MDDCTNSEDWLNMVDRGGLVHVTEGVYCFFHAVEFALRKHLKMKDAGQMTQGFKERLVASVTTNEDVLFYWCMITTLLEEEESDTLLHITSQKKHFKKCTNM